MSRISNDIQTFIVVELACYRRPSEVVDLVNQNFDKEISRQHVQRYDPTVGRKPGKKWCELFEKTRDEFEQGLMKIPIAIRQYRLRELQDMYHRTRDKRGADGFAKEVLKQAAEEARGMVSTSASLNIDYDKLTLDQKRRIAAGEDILQVLKSK